MVRYSCLQGESGLYNGLLISWLICDVCISYYQAIYAAT